MKRVLVAALVCAAGMAGAADRDMPKVGAHPAVPEVTVEFDRRITVDASVTIDRGDDPATEVTKAVQLRFDVGFTADEGAKDAPLRFTCRISFVRADGSASPVVRDGPCYEGSVADAAGRRVEIGAPLKFRPGRDDPLGATGVLLVIRDEVSRKEKRIMPTYGWAFVP
jgi:hypothetical protein